MFLNIMRSSLHFTSKSYITIIVFYSLTSNLVKTVDANKPHKNHRIIIIHIQKPNLNLKKVIIITPVNHLFLMSLTFQHWHLVFNIHSIYLHLISPGVRVSKSLSYIIGNICNTWTRNNLHRMIRLTLPKIIDIILIQNPKSFALSVL